MTLIFAPKGVEARTFCQVLQLEHNLDGPWTLHQGQVGRYKVVLLEAGVGKVAAAAAVAYARQRFNPSQGFWTGVARALGPDLKPLDLIVAQDAVQYDVDMVASGRAPGELATGERFVSADAVLGSRVLRAAQALDFPARAGRIATADRLLADPDKAAQIRETFSADAADLEGAAALWSAKKTGMPLALVRAITSSVGDESPETSEALVETASKRLATLVAKVLEG